LALKYIVGAILVIALLQGEYKIRPYKLSNPHFYTEFGIMHHLHEKTGDERVCLALHSIIKNFVRVDLP
jgi:hypothetical protein